MMEVNEDVQMESASFIPVNAVEETVSVVVCPTTGGQFEIEISLKHSVEILRKKIGRHLKIPHERLKILLKDRVLETGSVSENSIQDGSKLTLIPALESGFSSTVQGTQQSIIQAIEGLSDVQIDDFLSGRSPLTLALRVGDHMMFVQLQLEQSVANISPSSSATSPSDTAPTSMSSFHRQQLLEHMSHLHRQPPSAKSCSSLHQLSQSSSSQLLSTSSVVETSPNTSGRKGMDLSTPSSSRKRHSASALPNAPSEKTSHLDRLATACSNLSHSTSDQTTQSLLNKNLNQNETVANHQHRKPSTTCGKITSGVGSLSTHGSSGQGSRVMRQMQRLRRLCGAHQQCVAYSSRELASEISSIVHAAKHSSSESGGGASCHHRRSGKGSLRDRARGLNTPPQSGASRSTTPIAGASIDSVTTHGPGIFSGTFSGSLHPNIQDDEGRPKRDPQTILQILTDLLSATNNYEGQTGNIGMLPQLFKEHFSKQATTRASSNAASSEEQLNQASSSSAPRSSHRHKLLHQNSHHHHHSCGRGLPYPTSSRSGVHHPSFQHLFASSDRSAKVGFFSQNASVHRVSSKYGHVHGGSSSYYCNAGRRSKKPNIDVHRLQQLSEENMTTREKLHKLREQMQMRRMRRLVRRQACGPYGKRVGSHDNDGSARMIKQNDLSEASTEGETDTSLDVQIDDLSHYADDRKAEVAHESPETVIV